MNSGIYCIENIENGKKYIGQSIDIPQRWNHHRSDLEKHKHPNVHLQRAWDKYGCDNFLFNIVEYCDTSDLNDRERYWIKYYNSLENGYNQTSGGDGGNTIINYSPEQLELYKKRKSEIHKIATPKGEDSVKAKLSNEDVEEIIQRMLNGEHNVDIAKDYNVCSGTINDIRFHRTWKDSTEGIEFARSNKRQVTGVRGKRVMQFTREGEFVKEYISAREASRITGFSWKNISAVCNGDRRTHAGYIWKFAMEETT